PRQYFNDLRQKLAAGNARAALTSVLFLKNVLLPTPQYRRGLEAIQIPNNVVGEPIEKFLRLPNLPPTPSPPDPHLAFHPAPLARPALPAGAAERRWVRAVPLWSRKQSDHTWTESNPMLLIGTDHELVIVDPGRTAGATPREIQRIPLPGGSASGTL